MSVAVITGGAGGLGRALTAALLARGWHVVVLDLPGPALTDLTDLTGPRVETVPCDLTDITATTAACWRIAGKYPAIDLVIYNAGITQIADFAGSDMATHRRVFDINYFGAVLVARHLLRPVRQARGVHLAVSSVAGFSPLHRRTAYAASKHALQGFFTSLRSEESPHGVACLIAAPSFIATNPGRPDTRPDGTARPGSAPDGIDQMTPQTAARIILAAYDKRQPFTPVGRIARLSSWLMRLSPALFQRQMERRIARR